MFPEQVTGLHCLAVEALQLAVIQHQGFEPGAFLGQGQQLIRIGRHGGVRQLTFEGLKGAAGGLKPFGNEGAIHGLEGRPS